MDLDGQTVDVTGFAPGEWSWANERMSESANGESATLSITTTGVYTLNLLMREDGLRIDRLLLTTDTNFIPTGFGPPETERQLGSGGLVTPLTRTIVYTYDNLYRLTDADYTSGENYRYSYDKVGNRLQQIIDGDTTTYQYDAANRLAQLNGQAVYQFDDNGNLLNSDTLTNTFDAANRLIETERAGSTLEPIYNGVGDRVGQTVGLTTTYFALDSASALPEVIYTTEGNLYLHLPGVIMAENGSGEIRYLLSDSLGSVRQAVDESGEVVVYQAFDPYGNPLQTSSVNPQPYGFTGEWWERDLGLLHLRARWYAPETGTFLSVDPVESEPPYQYVRGNPSNRIDPSGLQSPNDPPSYCLAPQWPEDTRWRDDPVCQQWRNSSTPTPPSPTPSPSSPLVPVPSSPPQYSDNQRADGFATGISGAFNLLAQVVTFRGKETVWNFATREKMEFTVTGKFSTREVFGQPVGTTGFCTSLVGINIDPYFAYIWGFKPETSGGNFIDDYRGTFVVGQISGGVPLIETGIPASVGGGVAVFSSVIGGSWFPNFKVWGYSVSLPEASVGIGIQDLSGFGISALALDYTPVGLPKPFNSVGDMAQDLRTSGPPLVGLDASWVLLSHYPQ